MSPWPWPPAWGTVAAVAAVLAGSFIMTQVLLTWMQHWRLRRIEDKSLQLCARGRAADAAPAGSEKRVPITIVTGFLGSGKTTLVNRVLTGTHGRRVVVIENEVGAISIDHELIDAARMADAPAGVLVLKNGCMCCSGESPGSELERVLDQLLSMTSVDGGTLPFEYVLIETSGLADPAPIAQVLWRHEMAGSPLVLDGVVALVDAAHVMRHLRPSGPFAFTRRRPEVEKQLAMADRVVLNKADLVSDAEISAVEAAVGAINPSAVLMRARHADVPIDALLDNAAFSEGVHLERKLQMLAAPVEADHGGASVGTVSLSCKGEVEWRRLQGWLQELVAARHEDLYRLKGVLAIAGEARRFVVHGIHAQVQGTYGGEWGATEERRCALVLIGRGLERAPLESAFLAARPDADVRGGRAGAPVDETPDAESQLCEPCEPPRPAADGFGARLRRGRTQ